VRPLALLLQGNAHCELGGHDRHFGYSSHPDFSHERPHSEESFCVQPHFQETPCRPAWHYHSGTILIDLFLAWI